MIKKDYILRLVDEVIRLIARVLNLRQMQSYEEALGLLRRESERLIGIDGGMLEVLDADAIRKAVRTAEVALVAARILEEMSLVYEEMGEHERATATAVKTLDLYVGAMEADPEAVDAEYRARMSGLADAIAERSLTFDDRRTLMNACEKLGAFARAEDLLYDLLDESSDPARIIEDGKAFYARLLGKSDAELEAGGLPRDEVRDGMEMLGEMPLNGS